MRTWLALVSGAWMLAASHSALSRASNEYEADEPLILRCVEAAEKAPWQEIDDRTRKCIGQEATTCDQTTEHDTYTNRRMYCFYAEMVAWNSIMEKTYAKLIDDMEKCDKDQCSTVVKDRGTAYEAIAPALKSAHEAWLKSK